MNDKQFQKLNVICLIGYLVLLTSMMYISSFTANVGDIKYIDKIINSLNLIPFKELGNSKHIFTSIVMYMPVAILLPNCLKIMENRIFFYLTSILIISFIEMLQVVTLHGYGDINDIVFGFLGAIVVYELMIHIKKSILAHE